MSKIICAIVIAMVMTVTASAHIWNRPAADLGASQLGLRRVPCPVSYEFQHGFCVKPAAVKKDWFARAIGRIL